MKAKLRKELPYLLFILPAFIVYTILTVNTAGSDTGPVFTNWDGYSMSNLSFTGLKKFQAGICRPVYEDSAFEYVFLQHRISVSDYCICHPTVAGA